MVGNRGTASKLRHVTPTICDRFAGRSLLVAGSGKYRRMPNANDARDNKRTTR
jgi:hypothetical protein